MTSRKKKPKIKKMQPHTQADEKNRKIQLGAKTPHNPLIQPFCTGKAQPLRAAGISPACCNPLQPHRIHRGQHPLPKRRVTASAPHSTPPRASQTKSMLTASGSKWAGQAAASGLGAPSCFETGATQCLHTRAGSHCTPRSWGGPKPPPRSLQGPTAPRGAAPAAARVAASLGNSKTASQVLRIRGLMQFTSCC